MIEAPNATATANDQPTTAPFYRPVRGVGRPALKGAAFPLANRQALADECGVSLGHVCKVFQGYMPSLTVARKLAQALGLSVEEFVRELEEQLQVGRGKKKGKRKGRKAA